MKKVLYMALVVVLMMSLMSCDSEEAALDYSLGSLNLKGEVTEIGLKIVLAEGSDTSFNGYNMMRYSTGGEQKIVFNDDGMIEYDVLLDEDEVIAKRFYAYDQNNLLITIDTNAIISEDIKYKIKETFDLDDSGNLLISDQLAHYTYSNPDGTDPTQSLNIEYKVKLDDQNRVIEKLQKEGNNYKTLETILYNKEDLIEEMTMRYAGITTILRAEYNDENELSTLSIERKGEIELFTFTYKYDDQNNWTEQEASKDGVVISTMMRDILYK